MRTIYFDCSMGAAGDMLTAALLEVHPQPQDFLDRINAAFGGMALLRAERVSRRGIMGVHAAVDIHGDTEGEEPRHSHPHVGVNRIYGIIDSMPLPEKVRQDGKNIYAMLAGAESAVHGCSVESIHFHELGTMDALADIMSVCLLIYELAPEKIYASPVSVGSGTVKCAHGTLPVPAPATERLLRGVPVCSGEVSGELCTPTGAALLKYFADEFCPMPPMRVEKCGYGMGTKEFETLNALRVLLGETERRGETALELCCNLDDMTAEAVGFAMERLLAAGALDVWTEAIGMKKNRPGVMLCCLCLPDKRDGVLKCIFENTTTLGVRERVCGRYTLDRRTETLDTEYGAVRIKRAEGWGVKREKPEFEDIAAIAREKGISLFAAERGALKGKTE